MWQQAARGTEGATLKCPYFTGILKETKIITLLIIN
jgi:hypothetical protein